MKTNVTSLLLLTLLLLVGTSSCIVVPNCASSPTPADMGSLCDAGTRTLTWPAVTDATGYDVYLNAGTAAPTTLVSANQVGTSYTGTFALGNYTWKVIPKNSAGDASGCGFWSFTVVNSVAPTINISANYVDTFCAGTPVTYTATATNTGSAPFYQWKKNNANVGTNSPTYVDNVLATGDIVYVTMTSNSTACLTTTTATSRKDTVKSTILGIPVVDILAEGDTTFCSGGSVTLKTTAIATTYQWRRNGGNIVGENGRTFTAYSTGDYSVTASVGGSSCSAVSRSMAVSSVAVVPLLSRTGNTISTSPNYSVYQWFRNYTPIPGATTSSYTISRDGVYHVTATDNIGCFGTSAVMPVNNLAVGTTVNVDDIAIFPNPTDGIVQINSTALLNIAITDLQGKVVLRKEAANKIDVSHLANGIYMLQLTDKYGNLLRTEKLVKQDR